MAHAFTAEEWPIAACIHGFPTSTRDGIPAADAPAEFWAKQFRHLTAEGFQHVEIADGWIKPALLSAERRTELLETVAAAGLSIPSVHIARASIIDPVDGEKNLAYQHASVDAVADLGAGIYSTGLHRPFTDGQRAALWFWASQGPVDPNDDRETWDLAVSRFQELGRHAADRGLKVALELYEDTYLGSADNAVRLVEAIGMDHVGLNPDVGNLIRLQRPIEDWREMYAKTLPYANYWHLKNYTRDENGEGDFITSVPSTMRDGLINYRQVIELALEVGYSGVFTMEQYGGDSIGVCGENARYTRGVLSTLIDD